MLRVVIRKITTLATGSDRPRAVSDEPISGTLAVFVGRRIDEAGVLRATVADPDAELPREQAAQAVRTGRPLCVRLPGGYVWWSSAIREVEHDTRGLPVEVWTLAGSLYRLEFLDRTTLTLPGIVERAALAQGRE